MPCMSSIAGTVPRLSSSVRLPSGRCLRPVLARPLALKGTWRSVRCCDLYIMNPDGSEPVDIIPSNWPQEFLCSHGVFAQDDSKIYFVGEWWE
jgi:hypothetical protein